MCTHRANNPRTLNMLTHDTTNRTRPHLIARDISPQTHERERSLTLHFATRIARCDRSFLTWTELHTQPKFEAQHWYTRQKSPAQEPGKFRHVFHTRSSARLKEGGLSRSKHGISFCTRRWPHRDYTKVFRLLFGSIRGARFRSHRECNTSASWWTQPPALHLCEGP